MKKSILITFSTLALFLSCTSCDKSVRSALNMPNSKTESETENVSGTNGEESRSRLSKEEQELLELGRQTKKAQEEWQNYIDEENRLYMDSKTESETENVSGTNGEESRSRLSKEEQELLELGRQTKKAQEEWQNYIDEENRLYMERLAAEERRLQELEWRRPITKNYDMYMSARSAKYVEIDTTDAKRIKIIAECASSGTQLKFDIVPSLEAFNDFSNVSTDGGYSHYSGFNYLGKNYMREFDCSKWKHGEKIYLAMKNRNWAFDASVSVRIICYYNDNYN